MTVGERIAAVLPLSGITSLSNDGKLYLSYTDGFTTIWNYITLKRVCGIFPLRSCFTTIWNYITLKPLS